MSFHFFDTRLTHVTSHNFCCSLSLLVASDEVPDLLTLCAIRDFSPPTVLANMECVNATMYQDPELFSFSVHFQVSLEGVG